MTITKQFQENKTLINKSINECLNAVSLLKETVVKMQRYELGAELREMEKQLEQLKLKCGEIEL
jgi:hypothetical protein